MTVIQRCWYLTVRDRGTFGLLAEANYVDTTIDRSLILEIERKTLVIKNAVLEVHRGQTEAAAVTRVFALEGIPAYFGSGKKLRLALAETPAVLEMATQAVTAVIQAESFFYQERGFSSVKEYLDQWDISYQNTCVRYSNLDKCRQRSSEDFKEQEGRSNLYHRYLHTAIDISGEKPEIRGHLLDSYHEMSLVLQLDRTFLIEKALGTMLRCPNPICREALLRISSLKGLSMATTNPKKYKKICGGGSGCTHFTNLVQEAALTMDIYKSNNCK